MRKNLLKKVYYILVILFLPISAHPQENVIYITQLKKPIEIDGIVDDEWAWCDSVLLNFQLEPNYGLQPSRNTIVKVAQFEDSLYFLFNCSITNQDEITANIQQRDMLTLNEDFVSILIDTYNDNHSAILFQVNPLSTISDAKITNDGTSINFLWDTEWKAKARVNTKNWIAEINIPLTSIQYNSDNNTWGCNFSRSFRANQEVDWWQKMTENYRVSQSGELAGLQFTSEKHHRLLLFPYGTVRYEDNYLTDGHQTIKGDGGLDIRYSFGSNLNTNIAFNPDFATAEGDKEQINLTPWELKFPEKRLFFQDGIEMFDTRIQTFYSRRIGNILLGGKVNGKIGKYKFNGLYANTKQDDYLNIPTATFNAFRLKRDFLESSTIGLTYTNKITDTKTFHTFSADYNINLEDEWKLTGQFVGSSPGDFLSHSAFFIRCAKENNTYHYHLRYTELGDNFRENVNTTGFIIDDDRKEIDGDVNYKFWFDKIANYLELSGKNNVFWSQDGILRSWYITYGGRSYFQNKISLDFYYNNEYKNYYRNNYDNYYNYYFNGILGYNTDENNFIELGYRTGVNFKRDFNLLEFNSSALFIEKFSVSYEFKYLSFVPDLYNESSILNILGLSYFQNKDLWIRIFTQYSTNNKRFYLYGLAGWRFKPPFGALYLIYSLDEYQQLHQGQNNFSIVFLKFTYPINVIN